MPTHSTIFFPGLSILLFSFINKVLTVKGYFISSLFTIISITVSISISIYYYYDFIFLYSRTYEEERSVYDVSYS